LKAFEGEHDVGRHPVHDVGAGVAVAAVLAAVEVAVAVVMNAGEPIESDAAGGGYRDLRPAAGGMNGGGEAVGGDAEGLAQRTQVVDVFPVEEGTGEGELGERGD